MGRSKKKRRKRVGRKEECFSGFEKETASVLLLHVCVASVVLRRKLQHLWRSLGSRERKRCDICGLGVD